jgi:short subunit fatty acids transporter
MNDTTRQIGGALGVAVLGTLMNNAYLKDIGSLKGQIPPDAYAAVSNSVQGAHAIAGRIGAPMGAMIQSVADKAFVSGMTEAMLIAAFVMAFASAFTFAVLPARAHCIEPECDDEEIEAAAHDARTPAPAMGD